jgi:hypothetical protein
MSNTTESNFLTPEQKEEFLTNGFTVIRGGFTAEQAAPLLEKMWIRLGYNPSDKTTWTEPRVHMPSLEGVDVKTFAPKVHGAMCELVGGEDKINGTIRWYDGFIANFGADDHADTWEAPSASVPGWHVDGDFFQHFLDSPEQGLLTIVLWTDVVPTGGATFVAADSVPIIARYLAQYPEGVAPNGFDFHERIAECSQFLEATGKAGDVYLIHPFVLHASSKNALRLPRVITNPPISLKEPMQFNRPDGNYSLVEQAILNALGVDKFDFVATGSRERIVPERVKRQAEVIEAEKARLAAAGKI